MAASQIPPTLLHILCVLRGWASVASSQGCPLLPPTPPTLGYVSYPVVGHRFQPVFPQLLHQHLVLAQVGLAAHNDDGHLLAEVIHLWVPLGGEGW